MSIEELFVEKYKKLEEKIEKLEEELNKKNKEILESEEIKKELRKNMCICQSMNEGKRYIYFFDSPCVWEDYNKKEFDWMIKLFDLEIMENEYENE